MTARTPAPPLSRVWLGRDDVDDLLLFIGMSLGRCYTPPKSQEDNDQYRDFAFKIAARLIEARNER